MTLPSATEKMDILRIKNMVSNSCIRLVKIYLSELGVEVEGVQIGEARIAYNPKLISRKSITDKLESEGFPVIVSREEVLVEELKEAIIDLVHHSTFNAMVRNSDYLVERFNVSYQYLSGVFSKMEGITLEKYIILHKIEKAKALIMEDELSLSEIAFMMGYSSSQYLSTQFKSIAGVSVTEFKKDPGRYRVGLESIGKNK
jgi:AraC family transcriptional regulator